MVQRMDLSSLSENRHDQSVSTSSDQPLRASLVTASDLAAFVSFRGDPLSRPRWAAAMSTLSWGLDMANFEAVPVRIQGFELENVVMRSSELVQQVLSIIKVQSCFPESPVENFNHKKLSDQVNEAPHKIRIVHMSSFYKQHVSHKHILHQVLRR